MIHKIIAIFREKRRKYTWFVHMHPSDCKIEPISWHDPDNFFSTIKEAKNAGIEKYAYSREYIFRTKKSALKKIRWYIFIFDEITQTPVEVGEIKFSEERFFYDFVWRKYEDIFLGDS